jgi:hypothetical protein
MAAQGAADAKPRAAGNAVATPRAVATPHAGAAPHAAATANAGANVGANALPTTDEIHQLFKDEKYKETLQRLSRVLALKGEAAKAYDRHDLLRLRGETQLKLKDVTGAATSFEQAAKEAPDDKARAVDLATQAVIKRSKNLTFTPSSKKAAKAGAGAAAAGGAVAAGAGEKAGEKSGPIDVGDPEKRKDAFAVLFAEQKADVEPKLKAAKDAKTLPPVVDALQAAGGLRNLELAATDDDAQVKAMVQDLSARAQKMMSGAVKDMTDTVAQIEESANRLQEVMTPVRGPGGLGGVGGAYAERSYKKRGLMTPDVKDLRRVIADCQKLVPAVKELVDKLGESGEEFKQIGKDAVDVGNHAQKVLTTDYADSYTRSPRNDRDRRKL